MASPILLVAVGGLGLLLAARRRPRSGATDATRNRRPRDPQYVDVRPGAAERHALAETIRLQRIEKLLQAFVADEPSPGHFYLVQEGDNLPSIAEAALGTVASQPSDSVVEQYIYCVSSGPSWNVRLYATPSTSKRFGRDLLVPGIGKGLRVAFLPRNEDALTAMLAGNLPSMTVHPMTGAPLPGSSARDYGLLWLPPVDEDAVQSGEVTCSPFSWSDGSSSIDPPPELLAILKA